MKKRWLVWSGQGLALLAGLSLYGFSMALMVRAGLGLDPWDVFHQGLSARTGMSIGWASALTGAVVLLAWIPLRNRPGVGTIANIVVLAVTVDATLAVLPSPSSLTAQIAYLLGGVLLNAVATVLYVGAGLGPGPRDGLTTGLVHRTGRSVRLIRTVIEISVVAVGWLLGGTVGVGTVLYAVGIGPLIQLLLKAIPRRLLTISGWGPVLRTQREAHRSGATARRQEDGMRAPERRPADRT
ncbi:MULTISPECIES: YczE/YyaS/YitT family protein [Bacteria]|uniref:membrane protein YczE n=1 Tax=Bacteria TaxID=2 RepID=UPI003C79D539